MGPADAQTGCEPRMAAANLVTPAHRPYRGLASCLGLRRNPSLVPPYVGGARDAAADAVSYRRLGGAAGSPPLRLDAAGGGRGWFLNHKALVETLSIFQGCLQYDNAGRFFAKLAENMEAFDKGREVLKRN